MTRLVLTVMLAAAIGFAHDPKLHKGRQTKGEIVAVSADRLEMKTEKGNVTVLLSEKPKIESGDTQVTAAALKKGEPVIVIGTTLATGEIVAREILLTPRHAHSEPRP